MTLGKRANTWRHSRTSKLRQHEKHKRLPQASQDRTLMWTRQPRKLPALRVMPLVTQSGRRMLTVDATKRPLAGNSLAFMKNTIERRQHYSNPHNGLLFGNGSEASVDIVLGIDSTSGVSRRHFSIRIDLDRKACCAKTLIKLTDGGC